MRRLLTAVLVGLFLSTSALAGTGVAQKGKESVRGKVQELKEKKNSLSFDEALKALSYTDRVILLLHQGKKKEALKLIEEAQKSLSLFLKVHPNLQLLPVSQQIVVMEFSGDVKEAESSVERAKELLEKGRVQDARLILSGLADEIDVITTYLPVAMYSQVLSLAKEYIKKGKVDEAIKTLALVRGSLIVEEVPIPIPFIKAHKYVDEALKVAGKDRKKAVEYLEAARKELRLAKVLGYAYDYEELYSQLEKEIEKAESRIESGKESSALLKEIEKKISSLGKKAQSERKK